MATTYPGSTTPQPQPAPRTGSDGQEPTDPEPSESDTDLPEQPEQPQQSRGGWPATLGRTGDNVASVILGLLAWGWIVRPYLAGGTVGIRDVLRAKFLNQAKDGSQLP